MTDFVCTGLEESVTVKVGLLELLADGVPERMPVAGARLRPPGRALLDHVYGAVPPVALSVAV